MQKADVIESRFWKHRDGRTASLHGACPWVSEADKVNWSIETRGYTIRWPDGTIGTGRQPFETRAAAESYLATTTFKGWSAVTY